MADYPDFVTSTGYGTVEGLCGANCYHDFDPFIPGVSVRTYTDEQLAEMNEKENTPKEYLGKSYTSYEARQHQRAMERDIRAKRQKAELLRLGGADEKTIQNAEIAYRTRSHQYALFSKAMGLPQERERINYGLKSLKKFKENGVDKSAKSGIIEEKSKKSITKITDNAIEKVPKVKIDGYSDEQCKIIQQEHKNLLDYSRANNDNKEVAFVFNGDLTNRREFLGEDDRLDLGNELYGRDLFVMHNHPRNSSYSITDLIFFGNNNNIKTLTIVKNNGNIEYLTKSKDFNLQKFKLEYDRLYRKIVTSDSDKEKDKFVRSLLNKTKAGVIWSERQ